MTENSRRNRSEDQTETILVPTQRKKLVIVVSGQRGENPALLTFDLHPNGPDVADLHTHIPPVERLVGRPPVPPDLLEPCDCDPAARSEEFSQLPIQVDCDVFGDVSALQFLRGFLQLQVLAVYLGAFLGDQFERIRGTFGACQIGV